MRKGARIPAHDHPGGVDVDELEMFGFRNSFET